VEFVGRYDSESWIAKFPPELMSYRGYADGVSGRNRVLNRLNDTSSGEKENQDNENGDYGPGQFDLIAAIDLRGLPVVVRWALPKSDDRVDEERKHHEKNETGNYENEN
jgi:hypothetical protein